MASDGWITATSPLSVLAQNLIASLYSCRPEQEADPVTPTTDEMAEVLRPVAPPRILEGVYTDDQYERIVRMIQTGGPWPTITAHHFETVEELVATSTGVVPEGLDLTLDDVAT